MAIYTVTVTTGVYFAGANHGLPTELDFTSELGDDLALVSGRCRVTIRRHGVQSVNPLAGQVVQTLDSVMTVMAVQGLVSLRDIDQSGGKLRITDRKFRVSADDLSFDPKAGDQLQIEGTGIVYEVLGPDKVTIQNAWILWCRA